MSNISEKERSKKYLQNMSWIIGCIYAMILFWLNWRRIFDNNFWGDEVFTIRLSRMTFVEMLITTAKDVHPPLYYMITMLLRAIFGESGELYHVSALLAYLVVMIIAMTLVWKKWGGYCSVILMTFTSLLPRAVEYNVEARMYSWGSAFIILAFLNLYYIYEKNRKMDYVFFVLFSLCAAYTHYYCLISVSFFYVVLCMWALAERKKIEGVFKNTIIALIATILIYLPWLIVLVKTFVRTNEDYWITDIPNWSACMKYVFSGRIEKQLLAMFLILTIIYVIYTFIKKDKDIIKAEWLWYGTGVFSIIGTIFVGISVSKIFRPMLLLRYIYPVSIIAWFLVGIAISHFKGRWIYSILIVAYVIKGNVQSYMNLYEGNRYQNEILNETLSMTTEIGNGDIVYTDFNSIVWGVGAYYYPSASFRKFEMNGTLPELSDDHEHYFIVTEPFDEGYIKSLRLEGKEVSQLVHEGVIGTYIVDIYKVK